MKRHERSAGSRRRCCPWPELRHAVAASALALALTLAGVIATATATAAATAQTSTPTTDGDERTMIVSAYFLRDEKIGAAHREIVIPDDKTVAASSMRELLAGPTEEEEDAGLTTTIPDMTELLGISLESETKVATVDLSSEFESGGGSLSMQARLAQVVYTLTQFPTIETVTFEVEGEPVDALGGEGVIIDTPVGREDFEELTPLIFVESPTPGDQIESPVRFHGTANTFEATFFVQVVDDNDDILVEEVVTATSGSGTRGTFDVEISFTIDQAGSGHVVVFERSARDGSVVNEIEIPVEIEG